jgi:hypothetical protein
MPREQQTKETFTVGSMVRVKPGTPSDYPDIPMGGWAGVIREIDQHLCLVEFDKSTLDQVHPVYKKRCARDEFSATQKWLPLEAVAPDSGGPVLVEQPTQLTSRPLDWGNVDDRIREILGLSSDDPIRGQGGHSLYAFDEHFRMVTEARTQQVLRHMFPAIADWVQSRGGIEIAVSAGGVQVKLTDSNRVLFEDAHAQDLAEALNALENAIGRRLAAERPPG